MPEVSTTFIVRFCFLGTDRTGKKKMTDCARQTRFSETTVEPYREKVKYGDTGARLYFVDRRHLPVPRSRERV